MGYAEVKQNSEICGSEVFNREHLERYTLGDEALERELLELFAVQAQQQLGFLADCNDTETWRVANHTLKGAAVAVGAFAVAQLAENLENLAYNSNVAEQDRLLAELSHEVARCQTELLRRFGAAAPK